MSDVTDVTPIKKEEVDEPKKQDQDLEETDGNKFGQVGQFYTDVKAEMKKVTWPTRQEVYGTTVIVLVAVVFFGFFLWGADYLIGLVFKFLTDLLK
jgi:preprotein translocase subunit SecE